MAKNQAVIKSFNLQVLIVTLYISLNDMHSNIFLYVLDYTNA